MKMIPTSIVIPTLNEEQYLPALLDSLVRVTSPIDVIVVDGNSEDATVAVVERYKVLFKEPSSLTLVMVQERGISLQRNLGAAQAIHEILIFCDADVIIPSPEAHQNLVAAFSQRNYVAAAPRLVPNEPGLEFQLMFWFAYIFQKFLLLFNRPYFASAYLMTTKDTFKRIGGFDLKVLLGEDVDYSLRAGKIGRCAVINIPYPVSVRRIIKYGYGWMFRELPNLIRFVFTGRVVTDTIFYPFGEYGGQKPHYVTENKGT